MPALRWSEVGHINDSLETVRKLIFLKSFQINDNEVLKNFLEPIFSERSSTVEAPALVSELKEVSWDFMIEPRESNSTFHVLHM